MGCCDGARAFDHCTKNLPEARFCGIMPQLDVEPIQINLKETKDTLYVEAELPGFEKEDICILLAEHTLSISAERNKTKEFEGEYIFKETSHTAYQRTILLPFEVDGEKVKAYYNAGILRLDISKPAPEECAEKIEIN